MPPPGIVILDADTKPTVELIYSVMPAGTPFERRSEEKAHFFMRYDQLELKSKQLKWSTDGEEFALDLRLPAKSFAVISPSRHKSGIPGPTFCNDPLGNPAVHGSNNCQHG